MSDTNIFARLSGQGTQFLVYSMRYVADRPVAMILPLPVASPKSSPEKRLGLRFVNLKSYADFFDDMRKGFPEPASGARGVVVDSAAPAPAATLRVESVGDFVASFVPTLNDFDRLDPRFRLPRATWNQIPAYADYGFAVFQLRENAAGNRAAFDPDQRVHPMAFEFHTRYAGTVYFPTVHIHDEHVHPTDDFDHALYLQAPSLGTDGGPARISGPIEASGSGGLIDRVFGGGSGSAALRVSTGPAAKFVDCDRTQGAVDRNGICFRMTLRGDLPNRDTLVRLG